MAMTVAGDVERNSWFGYGDYGDARDETSHWSANHSASYRN